ncbi:MAG TPA: sodium:proton exchanger, partial [Gammaproteobacteria bacterium]|nr:sodium:proton exchanger [Gammaproteobacteria bacterium]
IIIIKLLSDKREVDSLHGRIAVGFLIVQDILVIVAMIALNALSAADTSSLAVMTFLRILFSGLLFLVLVALLMRYALTPFLNFLAQSKELLVLFSIAWAVSLAAIGYSLGLSKEVGAFVAGVSLASTPFREVIGSKLTTLRDFLLLFFFVDLGAALDFSAIGSQVQEALLFSLFVVVGNPLIVMIIMGVMGYRKRTGFLAGLTVAQISEFSLILAALGMSLGHIHAPVLGLITLVGLITISASTYLILYSHTLYSYLCSWLDVFERQIPYRELADLPAAESRIDIVVFGLGQFGRTIVDLFKSKGYRVLAIDFDPELVRKAQAAGIDAHYGDAEDAEFIATLPLEHARWIVSAMHDQHPSLALQQTLKAQQYPGNIIFAVKENKQRETLLENGGMVFVVHEYAAQHVAQELLNLDMSG